MEQVNYVEIGWSILHIATELSTNVNNNLKSAKTIILSIEHIAIHFFCMCSVPVDSKLHLCNRILKSGDFQFDTFESWNLI